MKKLQLIITFITIAAAGLFVSCDFPSDKMESAQLSGIEAEREMGITRSEIQDEIKKFRVEMAGKIMENNRSVADIKRKINNRDVSAMLTQEARIIVLQSENREMKRIMDNYKASGRDNWDEFKDSFSSKMDDLDDSLHNFFLPPGTTSSTN